MPEHNSLAPPCHPATKKKIMWPPACTTTAGEEERVPPFCSRAETREILPLPRYGALPSDASGGGEGRGGRGEGGEAAGTGFPDAARAPPHGEGLGFGLHIINDLEL
jgi:hypothetical protein